MPEPPPRWRDLALMAICALAVVATAEAGIRALVSPLKPRIEVQDGVADYQRSDPDLLVLGSSHARGFTVIAERLAAASPPLKTVLMAVERGKLSSYRWVLEHRLQPLIDQRDAQGRLVRHRLKRVVLVTEWWDACAPMHHPAQNIPGRAWTLADFWADVRQHGLRDYNRNYLNYQWSRRTRASLLLADRGIGRVPRALLSLVRPVPEAAIQADYQARVAWWQDLVESGFQDPRCSDPGELQDAAAIIDFFQTRHVEVTLVLFPRMPATITELAAATTLTRYAALMARLAAQKGIRLVDLSTTTPLTDPHFMSDFDHTTAQGNALLADWGLAGPLRFLLPAPATSALPAPEAAP